MLYYYNADTLWLYIKCENMAPRVFLRKYAKQTRPSKRARPFINCVGHVNSNIPIVFT